jgi:hypothetical protein
MATFLINYPVFLEDDLELSIAIYKDNDVFYLQLHIINGNSYCNLCAAEHNLHCQTACARFLNCFIEYLLLILRVTIPKNLRGVFLFGKALTYPHSIA